MNREKAAREEQRWAGPDSRLKRYGILLAFAWALAIAVSLGWNIQQIRKTIRLLAVKEARIHFEKDRAIRLWSTAHGGVYVTQGPKTPPNPHLAHIPDRDILTPSGKKLTLMNPAYMVRQMMDDYSGLYGVRGRIVSLRPLRAENIPDEWEIAALKAFEKGEKEVFEFVDLEGQPFLRLIQPIVTEKGCLKCHGHQGYVVGDIRGGIGVSVPMSSYLIYEQEEIKKLSISHILIFCVGILGIFLGFGKLDDYFSQRVAAEMKHEHAARRMEELLAALPVCIVVIDYETRKILDVNPQALAVFGCSRETLVGKTCTDYICPAKASDCPIIDQGLTLDKSERQVITHTGELVPVLKTGIITRIDSRKVLLECFIDITDKKRAEKELLEKEKLRVVLEMAGGVCHEFNQPLQIITGYCELLEKDGTLEKESEDFIRIIRQEVAKMGELTRNLRSITTYETKPYLSSKIVDITGKAGKKEDLPD